MSKLKTRKLSVGRETLRRLDHARLQLAGGALVVQPPPIKISYGCQLIKPVPPPGTISQNLYCCNTESWSA